MLDQDEQETDTKNRTSTKAFESLNFNIRGRSSAQITILGQDEHETDAKNRTSTNLVSQLINHLEIVKKIFQAFELLNLEVRARS